MRRASINLLLSANSLVTNGWGRCSTSYSLGPGISVWGKMVWGDQNQRQYCQIQTDRHIVDTQVPFSVMPMPKLSHEMTKVSGCVRFSVGEWAPGGLIQVCTVSVCEMVRAGGRTGTCVRAHISICLPAPQPPNMYLSASQPPIM